MPKVSFILPAYKRHFLHDAIASILAQTYRDFELVVVDDASPEGIKEIVDGFRDERLSYHRNSENLGRTDLVAAWNKALGFAKGEWVVCAGDDDVYAPEYLEEMLALSKRNPSVDVLHCRLVFIDECGNVLRLGKPRPELENGIEVIYHSCVARLDQRIPEFMYRRRALEAAGGFVASPRAWYSDIMTSIALSYDNGMAFSNRFLVKWRQSAENISCRYDDVGEKIEATVQFREWIWRLIDKVEPATADEAMLLAETRKGVDAAMMFSLKFYWGNVPVFKALKMLDESRLEEGMKSKMRRDRIRQEFGVGGFFRKCRALLGLRK